MKNSLLVVCAVSLSAVTGVFAQSASSGKFEPEVNVTVESDARLLAKGYAQSFGTLLRPPFTMTLQRGEKLFLLEDVRGVKEASGILVVEVGRGLTYMVNPKDVLALTDGPAMRQVP